MTHKRYSVLLCTDAFLKCIGLGLDFSIFIQEGISEKKINGHMLSLLIVGSLSDNLFSIVKAIFSKSILRKKQTFD